MRRFWSGTDFQESIPTNAQIYTDLRILMTSNLAKIRVESASSVDHFSSGVSGASSHQDVPITAPRPSTPFEETIKPTWETQKQARTYVLDIPAPRGQITDRNGAPLAQNKLSYNLAIDFPTPLDFSDPQVLAFARQQNRRRGENARSFAEDFRRPRSSGIITTADFSRLRSRRTCRSPSAPNCRERLPAGLSLKPIYIRVLSEQEHGRADHRLHRARPSRNADGIIQNGQVLWPETEGREGLEQTFNSMLTGHGTENTK